MQKLLILIISICVGSSSMAQISVGLFGGTANYQGDLVDKPFKTTRGAVGITASYELSSRISLRAGLTFAKLAGADSLNKKDLRLRNLSFQTSIQELSFVGEFNTFDLSVKPWSPYVFAGFAIYRFNPYTFDQIDNKVYLRPLSTEGQGLAGYNNKPYARTQLAIPFGAGIKFQVSEKLRIGVEAGLRKTFTDYLDDVSGNYADPADLLNNKGQQAVDLSYRGDEIAGGNPVYPNKGDQRGSPKYKDYYYFTGLHLSYRLPVGKGNGFASSQRKSGYGCPTVF